MAEIKWDIEEFVSGCKDISMDRLEKAADLIRDDMKSILKGKLKGRWTEHGPYKKYGQIWTERMKGAMVDTIRVVKKKDSGSRNIWIMAGTFKTWWATQMEYGNGDWIGGPRSFMRVALKKAPITCKGVLENG